MTETERVLIWARNRRDEAVVAQFWDRLCRAVRCSPEARADEVLGRLGRAGGNSIANAVRRHGVPYEQVAHHVARRLRGVFERTTFSKGDLDSCERFVLRKMEVDEDDVEQLCAAIENRGFGEAKAVQLQRAMIKGTAEGVAVGAARVLAARAAATAAEEAALRAAHLASTKVATSAATAAAREAAKRAAQQAAAQVARRVAVQALAAANVAIIAWTAVELAGPALRKTIPAVTYIALLRRLHQSVVVNAGWPAAGSEEQR